MQKRDAVPGLGEKLKAARAAAGLTQTQAANASGVHQVNISKFELDTKTPTLATLYKLAAAYGVDVCDMLPRDSQGQLPAEEEEPEPPAKAGKKKPKGERS
jgi:transcriptional regulator with XRE-family HTH domain